MLDINWNPSDRDLRQFAGIWLPAFAAIAGTVLYRNGAATSAVALWTIAGAIALVGLLAPRAIRPVFVGWTAAAYPIGWTVSHVVLGITYFGLFALVGAFMRLFRYDPLEKRVRPIESYWTRRRARADAGSYFRQF